MHRMTHIYEKSVHLFLPPTKKLIVVRLHGFGRLCPYFILSLSSELLQQLLLDFLKGRLSAFTEWITSVDSTDGGRLHHTFVIVRRMSKMPSG